MIALRRSALRRIRLESTFLLLAALTILVSPLPSAAQETEIAVSNIDRGHTNTERRSVPLAQGFMTGRRLGGYAIATVEIRYDDLQGDAFSAGIYSVGTDGFPTTEVIPLAPAGAFSRGKIVFTPSGSARRLDENTGYAVRVVSGDSDRDVDYLATYRGNRLDCPLLPTFDPNCTSMNDGWTIRQQLSIDLQNDNWVDTDYYSPAGVRRKVALSIRIKTLKVSNPPRKLVTLSEIGTVRLGWGAPTASGARPVTGYRYRHRINVAPPAWSDWVEQEEDLYHVTITGLTTGTEYVFQLQAGNDGGWSKAAKVITTITEPLGAPALTATANADGSIDLTWIDDAPTPKGYEVRWKRNTHGWDGSPGGDEQMYYCGVNDPEYTITGGIGNIEFSYCSGTGKALKTDGTVYDIEVRTGVIKGHPNPYVIWGTPATASVTPIRTAPSAPGNLVAEAGEKHVTLRWTAPSIVGSYNITDYEYRYKESAGAAWSEWRGTAPTTEFCSECGTWIGRVNYWQRNGSANNDSYVVVGLADGASYDFEMRAVNELSNASEPSVASATPVYGEFTEMERTPKACHVIPDPNSGWDVTCHWVAGSGQRSYADMKRMGYEVEGVKRDPDTGEISYELNTGDIPSMAFDHETGWEVARVSPSGRSAPQNVAQTPGMPGYLGASADGNRIDLVWLTTYPPSTSYEVEWSANGETGWQAVDPPDDGSDTMYSHTDLTPYTGYFYRVRGVNSYGHGPWSPQAYAETGAQRKPSEALTDFTASAVSATTVNLSWTAPSGDVTGYEVEWSADGSTNWAAVDPAHSGTTTRYSHTGLTANTEYFYRVRATGDDGVGEWSDAISARTAPVATTGEGGSGEGDGSADSSADSSDTELAAAELTAFFDLVPEAHDGVSAFTVELHFSHEVRLSYRTVRDAVLDVTGGVVTRARRLVSGSDLGWELSVVPDADGAVELVLPVPADCGATGAICTADGTPLSAEVTATVPGPLDG